MAEIISWSIDGLIKADASKCYTEMQTLEKITPSNVVDYARDSSTELHKCFEWNDSVAAEKYRFEQAKLVIRSIVITNAPDAEEDVKIRALQITSETNVYEPTRVILNKPDEYKALLERAKLELQAFKKRYKMLSELEEIFNEIDRL